MITTLMPVPKQQYFGIAGLPLIAGKIYTYKAGTNTLKDTYTDVAGTTKQPNPIPLNTRGEPANPIFWSGVYKVEVRDALDNVIYTVDNYNTDPAGLWGIIGTLAAADAASKFGFIQAGAGAVAQTVQDALRLIVSLKNFGAKGDGVTDDTAAIQKAIDSVGAGGLVYFPAGKYYVAGVVNLKNKVSLDGAGKSASEIYFGAAGKFMLQGTVDTKIGYLSITNLGLTNQGGGPEYCLSMNYAFAVLVHNCVVYNSSVSVSAFNYVTFDCCDLYTGQILANHPTINALNEALKVSKCKGSAFKISTTNTTDIMIDHTHLLGGRSVIDIARGVMPAAFYAPIWIDHTVVDSGDDEGILLNGVAPHISDCFVSGGRTNTKNGIVLTDCTEGSITNTMSRYNGKNGLFMRSCNDITVSGSAFNDNQLYGVSIGDSNNLRFLGNGMTNAPAWYGGSYVQQYGIVDEPGNCTNLTITGNQLGGSAGPLYVPGTSHTIHSNFGFGENIFQGTTLRPGADNVMSAGTASARFTTVYAATSTISTSDERAKDQRPGGIDAAVLRAWAKVSYMQYKFTDAIEKKGDGARWHFGLIAQRVKEAFESEGLNPFTFGLLCYDDWGDGNRYGIRYEEALALECAYLRSRLPH